MNDRQRTTCDGGLSSIVRRQELGLKTERHLREMPMQPRVRFGTLKR